MDIPATLVLIIVAAALIAWMTSPRTGQALDAWASGFIGYRSYGWPRGVQEEDEVHFSFREPGAPTGADEVVAEVVGEAELVELDGTAQEPIPVERLR
jgi:hypothetical protein